MKQRYEVRFLDIAVPVYGAFRYRNRNKEYLRGERIRQKPTKAFEGEHLIALDLHDRMELEQIINSEWTRSSAATKEDEKIERRALQNDYANFSNMLKRTHKRMFSLYVWHTIYSGVLLGYALAEFL